MSREGPDAESLESALDRIQRHLLGWPVLEAVIARREAGQAEPADAARAAILATTLCRHANADGSWGGNLLRSAGNLLLLRELTPDPEAHVRDVITQACAWLLRQRDAAGRFGEGCDPESHDAGWCEHAIAGFFSAGDPSLDLGGTTLPTGGRFHTDAAARFAATCLALRALLAWGTDPTLLEDARASVRGLLMRHSPGPEPLGCAGYACAVAATAEVHDIEPDRIAALAGLARLASTQRADGSWPGVDLFHVLEVLTSPPLARHRLDAVEAAIRRAAGMLLLLIGPDGSWGRESGPERTLVGWRTLRRALATASE